MLITDTEINKKIYSQVNNFSNGTYTCSESLEIFDFTKHLEKNILLQRFH